VSEPTQVLPLVGAPRPARLSPMVVARAVIVYQERPRRPWALWVFTVAIVALTVGVVLGQTAAFEPVYRPSLGAQAATVPSAEVVPSPSALGQPVPAGPQRVTAPLGAVRTRVLEVAGPSTVLRVRSADLGEALFDIATTDPGTVPSLTDSDRGTRLELVRTGAAAPAEVDIQLNAKVAWTLRLLGSAQEQNIDLRAGGVAGIEVAGGTARVVVRLPEPKGTVPLSVTGPVEELEVRREAGPVRLRLAGGADRAVVDGKTRRKVKAGAELTSAGWSSTKKRYDVTVAGPIASVVTATPGG
jgi:hypothetical protein